MSIRITCISKDSGNHENSHTAIFSLGWINELDGTSGTSTRIQLYDWIKHQSGVAFVRDHAGSQAQVGVAVTERGTKYVRTYRDRVWTDNLLSLPEC